MADATERIMRMNLDTTLHRPIGLLMLAILCSGCSETRFQAATGSGIVRGVNGSVDSSDVIFRNEEISLGQLAYKSASGGREWDNLSYTFNFDMSLPNADPIRLASAPVDVVDGMDYTILVAGRTADPSALVWERPIRDWEGTETELEIGFGHANSTLGPVDVYFLDSGMQPVLGGEAGTVDFGDYIVDAEYPAGDYQIFVTAPNDPATLLYSSSTVTLGGGDSYIGMFLDADPSITGPVSMRIVSTNGTTVEVSDSRFPPTIQFVNAAFGNGNIDVVVDDDYANPLVSDLPFGTLSADVDAPTVISTFAYAATGTTTPFLEQDTLVFLGSRSMVVVAGELGSEGTLQLPSDRRGIDTVGRYRFTHASFNAQSVDLYFLDAGETVDTRPPNLFLVPFGSDSGVSAQFVQTFDVVVTPNGEDTIIAGPVSVAFDTNDVVEIILLDTVDPNVGELLIFSNIVP